MPIIPEFLYDIRHPDAPLDSYPRTPLTINTPPTPTQQPCPCNGNEAAPAPIEYSTLSPEGKFQLRLCLIAVSRHSLMYSSTHTSTQKMKPIIANWRSVTTNSSARLSKWVCSLPPRRLCSCWLIPLLDPSRTGECAIYTMTAPPLTLLLCIPRIGYSIPMFAGFVIMFLSTISKSLLCFTYILTSI